MSREDTLATVIETRLTGRSSTDARKRKWG